MIKAIHVVEIKKFLILPAVHPAAYPRERLAEGEKASRVAAAEEEAAEAGKSSWLVSSGMTGIAGTNLAKLFSCN